MEKSILRIGTLSLSRGYYVSMKVTTLKQKKKTKSCHLNNMDRPRGY